MTEKKPSTSSLIGLDGMIFCLSDVRPGIGPFLSLFLKSQLHWKTDLTGLALGVADLTAACCQIPSGAIVDTTRYKRLIIFLACLAIALSSLQILFIPTFSAVIGAQILIGMSTALIPPTIAAITLGLVGRKSLPKRISLNETWAHAGNVFTAALVGLLSYLWGHEWILYMIVLFAAGSTAFVFFINPKEIDHQVARELPKSIDNQKSKPLPISQYLKNSPLAIFCLSVFLFHFSNAAQLPLVGQLLGEKNPSIDTLFMSACIILAQIVMIFVAYGMGFLMNYTGRKPLFSMALAVLPLRAVLYTFTDSPTLLLSIQLLDGIGAGIFGVLGIITISDIAKDTGRFNFSLGMMSLAQGTGASLSNMFAGVIVEHWNFNYGFMSLAFIGIFGLGFYCFCMPETKNRDFKLWNS
ncbi:MAG: MFS transporter [Chlamydiales bacterium 38-26]|nr:MFS transporter [Chlamydiales bacterium]OJV08158.1 MAG: MFS transporter [Chlamydiales bacterium 38-26]